MEISPGLTKVCSKCGVEQELEEFYAHSTGRLGRHPECKPCYGERTKRRYAANPQERAARSEAARRHRLRGYGLTPEGYEEMMAAQGNRCAACHTGLTRPHVDHCHDTGRTRGILCFHCNTALGLAKDDIGVLRGLITYLETHRGD